jgi:hypothetical protein
MTSSSSVYYERHLASRVCIHTKSIAFICRISRYISYYSTTVLLVEITDMSDCMRSIELIA